MKLFGRYSTLRLGSLEFGDRLAYEFEVKATAKGTPNTSEISIYNLSPSSRKSLEEKKLACELTAGYEEGFGVIFKGEVRNAYSTRTGGDIVTKIEAGDGVRQMQSAYVAETIAPGETAAAILEKAANALGVGLGNLADVLAKIATRRSIFPEGGALFGPAYDQLARVARAYGYTPSIQNGVLLLLENTATRRTAEVFREETGLIGSPKVDAKGKVSFDALLRHSVAIGDAIKLEAEFVQGFYRVLEYTHKGKTMGDATWTTSFVCDSKV